jgi:hypothetical protein
MRRPSLLNLRSRRCRSFPARLLLELRLIELPRVIDPLARAHLLELFLADSPLLIGLRRPRAAGAGVDRCARYVDMTRSNPSTCVAVTKPAMMLFAADPAVASIKA